MLPDRVSSPGPLTYESGALPIALRGPALSMVKLTYLLVGKVLNVFWCANQNLKFQNSTVSEDS